MNVTAWVPRRLIEAQRVIALARRHPRRYPPTVLATRHRLSGSLIDADDL